MGPVDFITMLTFASICLIAITGIGLTVWVSNMAKELGRAQAKEIQTRKVIDDLAERVNALEAKQARHERNIQTIQYDLVRLDPTFGRPSNQEPSTSADSLIKGRDGNIRKNS